MAQLAVAPVPRLSTEDRANVAAVPAVGSEDQLRFERALAEATAARRVRADGDERVSRRKEPAGAGLGDRILSGVDSTAPAARTKAVDDIPPASAGVVRVSNGADLARALATAKAGQHIVLADGIYHAPGGKFEVKASGTQGAPIVIRAESALGARLTSELRLSGDDVIASGLLMDGAQVELSGDRARLTGSRSQNHDGIAVLISGGTDARVDHNELVGLGGRGISVKPSPGNPEALLRPRIDHNWIHDFTGTRNVGTHSAIQIGQCLAHTDCSVQAIVEHNLIEGIDQVHSVISVKSSDNVIRANTVLDSAGGIVNRHGERNLYEANWIEGARGMWIRDADNQVIGNTIVDSGGFGLRVLAGNVGADSRQKGYPNAVDTVLIGNDLDRLIVGFGWNSARIAAQGTVIEGSQGAKVQTGMAQGTVQLPNASVEVPKAVRLTRADVGPAAVGTEVASGPGAGAPTSRPDPAQPSTRPVKGASTPGERVLTGIGQGDAVEEEPEVSPPDFLMDPAQLAAMLLSGTRLWNPALEPS